MRSYARALCLAGIALALVTVMSGAQAAPSTVRPAEKVESSAPMRADTFQSSREYRTEPLPVRLRIPALHVDNRLDQLGVQRDGTVEVPAKAGVAGWFDEGPRPGQNGPAVLLGHVDSKSGPGIFFSLLRVKPGTLVHVDREDRSTVTFRITHLEKVSKTEFPTDLVYAPSLDPTLRLVTCGGVFDHSRGSYRDNVIAFADLVR